MFEVEDIFTNHNILKFQAPLSMKSVLQSCWHLMNGFGNIIVILSAQGKHNLSQVTFTPRIMFEKSHKLLE